MKIKIELLAESDERKIYVTNSKFLKVIYEKEEKAAKITWSYNVVHILYNLEDNEDLNKNIEEQINNSIFDITVKTAVVIAKKVIENTNKEE